MIGKGLVWDSKHDLGRCWEILFYSVPGSEPHWPQDWFILRNIKKQCSGFTLLINLLSRVIIFICLLLFPPGSKEVLYLRDDSLLRATKGFESHTIEVPFHPHPQFIIMGEKLGVVWGLSMISQNSTFVPQMSIFQSLALKSLKVVAPEEAFVFGLTSVELCPFSIPLSNVG